MRILDRLKPARIEFICLLFLVMSFLALAVLNFQGFDEDAFISFRYAQNLASGLGPVYNPGDRTEGFSNPLWVFMLAFFKLLGVPVHASAFFLGIILAAASGVALFYLGKRIDPGRPFISLLSPALLFSSIHYIVWSGRGLENGLVCFLIALSMLRYFQEMDRRVSPLLAVYLGLLALSRPEGIIAGAAFMTDFFIRERAKGVRVVLDLIRRFYPLAVLFFGYELFRLIFYRDFLPNSYYFKLGKASLAATFAGHLQSGVIYMLSYIISDKWFILGLFLLGLNFADRKRSGIYRVSITVLIL